MLWTLIVATRPSAPLIAADSAKSFGRVGGPLVGVGMMGVVIFGIWLAIDDDAYHVWDGWIIASLMLWAIAGAWACGPVRRSSATRSGAAPPGSASRRSPRSPSSPSSC